MSWNHRVLRQKTEDGYCYAIHEVYYDADGRPTACTENPVKAYGENIDELSRDIESHKRALTMPILDYDSIGVAVSSMEY